MTRRTMRKAFAWIVAIALLCFCLIWIYPFLWMISASMKTTTELFQKGLDLIPDRFSLDSYYNAWIKGGFSSYFMNSQLFHE